ncbi:ATP-dependent RNA helicase eIF4A [Paramyrothecium foliicola]|nr:ATP-dependent RNA helicase eIF4A [Paramyrothecium foliicola]
MGLNFKQYVAIQWTLLSLCIAVLTARIGVRIWRGVWSFWLSDSFLILSFLFFLPLVVGDTVVFATGRTFHDDSYPDGFRKWFFATTLIFDLGFFLARFSLLAFYHKLFPISESQSRRLLWIVVAYNIAGFLTTGFVDIFWCGLNVSQNWSSSESACSVSGDPVSSYIVWPINISAEIFVLASIARFVLGVAKLFTLEACVLRINNLPEATFKDFEAGRIKSSLPQKAALVAVLEKPAGGIQSPSAMETAGSNYTLRARDRLGRRWTYQNTFLDMNLLLWVAKSLWSPARSKRLRILAQYLCVRITSEARIVGIQSKDPKTQLLPNGSACIAGAGVLDYGKDFQDALQVVVEIPGRLRDLVHRNILKTANIDNIALDDADEILARGFADQIYDIFRLLPQPIQVLVTSATMPQDFLEATSILMCNPHQYVKKKEFRFEGIKQFYFTVEKDEFKLGAFLDLYASMTTFQTITFCSTRKKTEWLTEELISLIFPSPLCTGICPHLNVPQLWKNFVLGRQGY